MEKSTLSLPAIPRALVTDPADLAALCDHLAAAKIFAFDTEFIGENTYHPILCLIQVATTQRVELIDPLALDRDAMRPFWQLLADESLEKICHAGDQDVEIAWLESGLAPRNMFDTQIGAGMLGISYPTALWRAVHHFTGIELEKAHTYSAWNRRPLSNEQFAYAVDDVRYLPLIHSVMVERLTAAGHLGWMHDACAEMTAESAKPVDARRQYTRIRGAAGLQPVNLAVLREVTALREQIAFEDDLPPRVLLKDEVLFGIAQRLPHTPADLARVRDMPPETVKSLGSALLAAVRTGEAVPADQRPSISIPPEDSAEEKRQGETLWVAAQAICLGQSVSPALVTSQSEIMSLARLLHDGKPIDAHPLMRGWHRQCLGDKLVAFIRGELDMHLQMHDAQLHATFQASSGR